MAQFIEHGESNYYVNYRKKIMSLELEKDPSEDREEFERRLKSIFNMNINIEDAVRALLLNDTVKIAEYASQLQISETKKIDYLAQWDAGVDKAARMNVVGSVKQ